MKPPYETKRQQDESTCERGELRHTFGKNKVTTDFKSIPEANASRTRGSKSRAHNVTDTLTLCPLTLKGKDVLHLPLKKASQRRDDKTCGWTTEAQCALFLRKVEDRMGSDQEALEQMLSWGGHSGRTPAVTPRLCLSGCGACTRFPDVSAPQLSNLHNADAAQNLLRTLPGRR